MKRVAARERIALQLVGRMRTEHAAGLPRLLATGRDAYGEWVIIPFYDGEEAGLLATPPAAVFETLGRLHATFAGQVLPDEFERLDDDFIVDALTRFAPDAWQVAACLLPADARDTASRLTRAILGDASFMRTGTELSATFLHGDVYGANVLLSTTDGAAPTLIDWGCARVGPAMFDVAMTVAWDSDERRAHLMGWSEVAGRQPDLGEQRLGHAWARALTCLVFAPIVAARAARADGDSAARLRAPMQMLEDAVAAWRDYTRLRLKA